VHQLIFEGRCVTTSTCQCLIRTIVKWCLNVIDQITPLTAYSNGRVGG
jgi:hypothetical protein